MIFGVTGSRHARPQQTVDRLRHLLAQHQATELHHGDCVGWDKQAHEVAKSLGIKTIAHPPSNGSLRAYCDADEVRDPLPYLDRNKAIVAACERLVAAPDRPEETRSGTWSTVRHAKKSGVKGWVLSWEEPGDRPRE